MARRDEDIKKDVIDQLYWDDRVDASDIEVSVTTNIVVVPTRHVRDQVVAEQIQNALSRQAEVNEASVHVEVRNGRVTLSGGVPSRIAHKAVHDTALHTKGVTDIEDRVVISLPE